MTPSLATQNLEMAALGGLFALIGLAIRVWLVLSVRPREPDELKWRQGFAMFGNAFIVAGITVSGGSLLLYKNSHLGAVAGSLALVGIGGGCALVTWLVYLGHRYEQQAAAIREFIRRGTIRLLPRRGPRDTLP